MLANDAGNAGQLGCYPSMSTDHTLSAISMIEHSFCDDSRLQSVIELSEDPDSTPAQSHTHNDSSDHNLNTINDNSKEINQNIDDTTKNDDSDGDNDENTETEDMIIRRKEMTIQLLLLGLSIVALTIVSLSWYFDDVVQVSYQAKLPRSDTETGRFIGWDYADKQQFILGFFRIRAEIKDGSVLIITNNDDNNHNHSDNSLGSHVTPDFYAASYLWTIHVLIYGTICLTSLGVILTLSGLATLKIKKCQTKGKYKPSNLYRIGFRLVSFVSVLHAMNGAGLCFIVHHQKDIEVVRWRKSGKLLVGSCSAFIIHQIIGWTL